MDRRAFLLLKLSMGAANKLSFAATKRKEEEEAFAKSAAVSTMISVAAPPPAVAAAPVVVAGGAPAAAMVTASAAEAKPAETKRAKKDAADIEDASVWSVEQVAAWGAKSVSAFAAAKLTERAVTGKDLLQLPVSSLNQFVDSPMDKRKFEHALSKLQEPARLRQEAEEAKNKVKRKWRKPSFFFIKRTG